LGTSTSVKGSLSYTAGQVVGSFEKWFADGDDGTTFTFPVGTASYYRPAAFTLTTIGVGGTLLAKFVETGPGNSGLSLTDGATTVYNSFSDGYWDISVANSFTCSSYNLDITATSFAAFTIEAATRLLSRTSSGTDWVVEGSHVNASGSTVQRDGMSTITRHHCLGDDTSCTGPSTSAITGNTSACTSETGVAYSVTNNTASTYTWTITGGTKASGGTTNSITVDWGTTGMTGTVKVVENNGCTTGDAVTKSVTIHSAAPSSVTGANIIAENTNGEPYSVTNTTNYAYTWTITGGTQASGGTTNSITVDWGSNGTGTVSVVAKESSCPAASATELSVTKYIVINSIVAPYGDHDATSSWDCACTIGATDNLRVVNGDSINVTGNLTMNHLTIDAGGVLYIASNKEITVNGNFTVNGKVYSADRDINLDGNIVLDGTGTIYLQEAADNLRLNNSNKTIKSTAVLKINGGGLLYNVNDLIITNDGKITIDGGIDGNSSTGISWINSTNSTLEIGGSIDNVANWTLTASASGNTVNYYNTGTQTLINPASSQYYHLTTTSGTFTLPAALDIDGNLNIASSTLDVSGSNYSITLAGNFVNTTGTFTEQSGTITLNGSSIQTFGNANSATTESFYNLVINNTTASNSVTLSSPISIANATTFTDGHVLSTSTKLFKFASGATSSGYSDASHVTGPVVNTYATASSATVVFPIGKGEILHRADLTVDHDAATTTEYTGEFIASSPVALGYTVPGTLEGISTVAYFTINKGAGANVTTATAKLFYIASDGVSDAANLAVVKDDGAGAWTDLSGTAAGSPSGNIVSGSFSSFSAFALANKTGGGNALPVELLDFQAALNQNVVDIVWTTGTEINNDEFSIERGTGLNDFESIGTVAGAGNSTEEIRYTFVDFEPLKGISYYRLKQKDFDGKYKFSFIAPIKYGDDLDNLFGIGMSMSPNPAQSGNVLINIEKFEPNQNLYIEILDELGRLIHHNHKHYTNSNGAIVFNLKDDFNLPHGIYLIKVSAVGNRQVSKRLINN